MGWKRKEKELSPEEAVAAAKAAVAPFWSGLSPQFTAVETASGVAIFPLEPLFSQQTWLFAFLDLTDVVGEHVAKFLHEWRLRYSVFDIQTLLILEAPAAYSSDRKLVAELLQEWDLPLTYVVDDHRKIAKCLGLPNGAGFLFYRGGDVLFSARSVDEYPAFEEKLQDLLRSNDPGLPLFPVFRPEGSFARTETAIEFGSGSGFPFQPVRSDGPIQDLQDQLKPGQVLWVGEWSRDEEKILTSDGKARLIFLSPTPEVHLLAASMTKLIENGRVSVEVNGAPPYPTHVGDSLTTDESGQSFIPIRKFGLYKVLRELPGEARLVELRFPSANRIPIGLFGIRFVDIS